MQTFYNSLRKAIKDLGLVFDVTSFTIISLLLLLFNIPTALTQINWTVFPFPVLIKGNIGSWDETSVCSPEVIYDGDRFHMWYQGWDRNLVVQIGYATSSNGTWWTKHPNNPVLRRGEAGAWDDRDIYQPAVVRKNTRNIPIHP